MPPFRSIPARPRYGLARVLSKLGVCSRAEAGRWIGAGRVRVNGVVCRDPEQPTDVERDRVEVDGQAVERAEAVYFMLNKPRGLVTSTADERGRPTVYECLRDPSIPNVVPVGRLDQASEGLLLFTNDTGWAARLTAPESRVEKAYQVQVRGQADEADCRRLESGVVEAGEVLEASTVGIVRAGERNTWLEIVLTGGKNRQIRRMVAVLGFEVLRLIRIRVGGLLLGDLPKGSIRRLTMAEVRKLG